MYKLYNLNTSLGDFKIINKIEDGLWIPFDDANTDYQAYLKWLAEGNEPLPADEPSEG